MSTEDAELESGDAAPATETSAQVIWSTTDRDREIDYRSLIARPTLALVRQAKPGRVKPPLHERLGPFVLMLWTLAAVLLALGIVMGLDGASVLLTPASLFVFLFGVVRLPRIDKDAPFQVSGERLDRSVRVEVDDSGVHSTARDDEKWTGSASRKEIERVYAQPWHGGVARVRVALHSGHHYTLVDGLFDEQEALEVARAIEERLE